ncbi:MAG: SBBP repeat-containing protein, partial [Acidobacteriaceae bacterium]
MPKGRGFLCFVRLFLGKASIKNSDLRIPFAILLSFSLLISDFSLWIPKATEAVSVVFDKGEENAGEKPKLTLPFVENIGQFANKDLKFYVNTQKATVSVTEDGISYAVRPGNERSESKEGLDKLQSAYFSESFVASDGEIIKAVPYGAGSSGAVISAFLGNDKTKWKSKIPNYQEVKFDQVWDKVNVSLSASRSSVEKIFEIEPGGNPSDISMSIDGSFQLRDGKLFISTPAGEAYMTEPKAFQLSEDGTKSFVDAVYDLRAGSIYGFAVFDYDRSKTLIIDPLLGSTFLEGASNLIDYAAISVAADGSIFVAGETRDPNFDVTPGVWDSTFNGGLSSGDFVIAKFNSSLTQLLALTYLGGTSDETSWNSTIAFDAAGNVFISGDSSSADYPVVTGAYDESYNGSSDLVISKLSSDLTQLLGSTFVGSTGNEDAGGVAVDGLGNVYSVTSVASGAGCNTFPKTTGAAFETCDLATTNSGVVKLNNDLTTFLAGTYMHGEEATAIALDSTGNIFITGVVTSNLLYTTALAFDKTFGGYYDVGVTKINSDMTSILASTYLGGNHYENPAKWSQNALAIDSNDNVFVGGETQSTDFPTTVGAYDRTYSDYKDSFLTKFDNTLTNVLASTYLGGDGTEEGAAIAIDSSDNVYFTAYTDSSSFFGDVFSTTAGTYQENEPGNANDGDPFVSKFNNDLTSLLASTYLGGPGSYTSYYQAIALDATNNVYVAGPVEDPNFPTTAGAYDRTLGSSNGFFISKLDSGLTGYAMNHLEAEAISDVESDGFETGFDSAFWDDAYSPSPYGANSVSSVFYLPSGKILIGGSFTAYNKTAVSRVARLNADGSLDTAFVPPTINNTVNSLGVQSDGKIVIAGAFTTVGATSRNRIARLNADGSFDASFDPGTGAGSSVYELAIQSDDKVVVAGSFTAYGGTTINNLVRLNSNGSLDGGFNAGGTGAGSYVNDLLVQGDGKIVIGGAFITYNGTGRSRVARINADGTLDGTFDPGTGASSTVETVGIQSDGKIMIGGRFSSYDGTGRNYIARINADGTLDNTFNPGTGASSYVYDLLVLPGDKTLISGGFATYNGTARPNYAKINTDGTLDGSFTPAVPNLYSNALTIQTDNKLLLGGFFT